MSKPHAVSLLRPTHFLLLLCLLAVFGVAQAATVKPTKLVAEVGPGFTITLKKAKKRVVTLKRGKYVITVRDRATDHNFRLVGPGVNRSTQVRRLDVGADRKLSHL